MACSDSRYYRQQNISVKIRVTGFQEVFCSWVKLVEISTYQIEKYPFRAHMVQSKTKNQQ